ncbi:MAG: hypothetical protein R8G66_07765 [Cytophagales bacterium]|nr:hypothetical protein [Cytophagales bacterium]
MSVFIEQQYESYSEDDHKTWKELYEIQNQELISYSSEGYQLGYRKIALPEGRVVNLDKLNEKLGSFCGWQAVGVRGLVPTKEFFFMLMKKNFPVSVQIRKPQELGFSKLPDIFHDVCGHVPMLLNDTFSEFVKKFSELGLKHFENEKAVLYLSRLYWYTLEMGLIYEEGEVKPYGGAILTSRKEIKNIYSNTSSKHDFDVYELINTPYDNLKLQTDYFVIDSYDQLFTGLEQLEVIIEEEFNLEETH